MVNPLTAISEVLHGVLSRKKEWSVVGVDIGSSSIKVVQLRKRRGIAVLETYGELSLGPYAGLEIGQATGLAPEKLTEALTDLFREANVTTRDAGISIPFTASLTNLIEMPAVDDRQLAQMIPIEARKYVPVPIGEVTLDWFVVPKDDARFMSLTGAEEGTDTPKESEGKRHVLLVAIHNDALQKFQSVAEQSSIETSFFEIEVFSSARAVLGQGVAPVMIIDMGAATTKLYIVEYGIVRLSHVISKGSQDITLGLSRSMNISIGKAERLKREFGIESGKSDAPIASTSQLTLDHIFGEVNRFVLSYQQRQHKTIERAILTGGGASLKGIHARAEQSLNATVESAHPFEKTETPAFLEDTLREVGPTFSVAVGLALRKLQSD